MGPDFKELSCVYDEMLSAAECGVNRQSEVEITLRCLHNYINAPGSSRGGPALLKTSPEFSQLFAALYYVF